MRPVTNIRRDWKFKVSQLYPVLLAGGAGTRLWPLSRKTYPKQFSNLIGDTSLFQASAQRLTSSDIVEFTQHITLTNSDFRFIIEEQLQDIGIDPGPILIEPEAKNTAAAILAASIFAHSKEENSILLVAPSDHVIPDTGDFHEAIKVGLTHAQNRKLVTFGIKPTHPETGYGYLELLVASSSGTVPLKRFVEKLAADNALSNFASIGRYVLTLDIFDILRIQPAGVGGGIQLADAINTQAANNTVEAVILNGLCFDCGSVSGYLAAIMNLADR